MRLLAIFICAACLLGCSGKSTMPPGFNEACYGGDFNGNLVGLKPTFSAELSINRSYQPDLRNALMQLAKKHNLVAFDEGAKYQHQFFSIYLCSANGAFAYVDNRGADANSMHVDVFSYKSTWQPEAFVHDLQSALQSRWPSGLKQRDPADTTLENSIL